jgi:hypothetical protein
MVFSGSSRDGEELSSRQVNGLTSYGRRWRCLRRPSPATRITAPPLGLRLPTSDRKPQRPPIAETKPHGDSG